MNTRIITMTYLMYKKSIRMLVLMVLFLTTLSSFVFANTYINNSIEIEATPQSRSYNYGEDVTIDINVKNKNRYGKLYYKIIDIYSGGGFDILNLDDKEKVVNSFESSSISVELRDKYYSPEKKRNKGAKAYGLTDKEYEEFERYRNEKVVGEKVGNKKVDKIEKEQVEIVKSQVNATTLVVVIIILIIVIIILFIWFIMKSKSGGGFRYMSIVLVVSICSSLFFLIISKYNISTYAADIYQENVKYNKTVSTQVRYSMFDCTFDVKIEYYFVNTIAPITDLELDTDNDILPDYLEVLYLTDLYNNDTDNDGLYDGVEVYRTYTDPLRIDTDNNGIKDSDEDYDKDGLSNIEEKNYNTDYDNIDTDFDNISDYDEIKGVKTKDGLHTYTTDPLNEDTDNDGLRDDTELKLNLNPLNSSDANNKVSQKSDESSIPRELGKDSPIPILFYGELIGDIDENVKVKISNNNFFDIIDSKIGNPIVIDTTYDYNSGLKIEYDISKYENIKDRLQLCKYVDGEIIPVERTYIQNNKLLGDVYSGEYVLIDSKRYTNELKIYIK